MSNNNAGKTDRIIRLTIGCVLAFYVLLDGIEVASLLGGSLLIAGIILIVTAAYSFCPLYRLLGINTCKPK